MFLTTHAIMMEDSFMVFFFNSDVLFLHIPPFPATEEMKWMADTCNPSQKGGREVRGQIQLVVSSLFYIAMD